MLGGVVAPHPSASSSVPFVNDIIECFDNNGEPVTSLDLVPVAMVRYTLFFQVSCIGHCIETEVTVNEYAVYCELFLRE